MKKKLIYIVLIAFIFVVGMNFVYAEETTNSIKWVSDNKYTICGINNVPDNIPVLTSNIYKLVKILVPIILIVMGIIDFVSATTASDLDKMKKAQKKFITRLLAGVFIFFIMAIVQFAFKKIDFSTNKKVQFWNCMDCLLNNKGCDGKATIERRPCSERGPSTCIDEGANDKGHSCTVYNGRCRVDCTKINSASTCNNTYKGVCQWSGEYNKGKCTHIIEKNDSNYYAPIKNNGDINTTSQCNYCDSYSGTAREQCIAGCTTANTTITPSGTTIDTTTDNNQINITPNDSNKTCIATCKNMSGTAKERCVAGCSNVKSIPTSILSCSARGISSCTTDGLDKNGYTCTVISNKCKTLCSSIVGNEQNCEKESDHCKWTGTRCVSK